MKGRLLAKIAHRLQIGLWQIRLLWRVAPSYIRNIVMRRRKPMVEEIVATLRKVDVLSAGMTDFGLGRLRGSAWTERAEVTRGRSRIAEGLVPTLLRINVQITKRYNLAPAGQEAKVTDQGCGNESLRRAFSRR